jgi:acyl transferase domain-containing protein/3-hydroxymyristoyl/3-hydroxydecanoyl-(acyl carrier protein) dehydratase
MTHPTERVAIVGMAGRFPGAGADLDRFWDNVASATDCSSEVPPGRWAIPPERCLDPRVANPDTVYSARGYFLEAFEPDLAGLDIDPALVAELDRLFHLVLDTGNRAWHSAKTQPLDRRRVGVVLGNICLPTDRANDLCREYLGGKLGLPRAARATNPLNRYVAGLPAGVLAKALGLGGGSYTLDAACASSLYAIKLAADELLAGRADAVLAGGVNGSDSFYTQMGFAQLRALSPSGRCSPFDARADGLMVGEGAGVFVLKRLADAVKHGDKILGVVAGVGLSNDMHGNLLAPAEEGQLRAMRKAYERAGWQPQDVQLIECHATGTPVGDAVEFESLRELWGNRGWAPGRCAIGSVKSTVGHLLTGAGAAAVAKVLCAIAAGELPPEANFSQPAAGLSYADGPFRVLGEAERWRRPAPLAPRRAAVSGFGFGGVNAHLLLEEWVGNPVPNVRAPRPGEGPKLVTVTPAGPKPAPTSVPVAVVGMAAHFGPWGDLRAFQERVLGGDGPPPAPKRNGWGLAGEPCPPGYYIEELHFPTDRFRIPPKELEETLPQQLLMLQVAAAALDDCQTTPTGDQPGTGVFIGLGLDPNTTNFHLRWSALAGDAGGDLASPPLSANRVMGALGSIAASRIARAFHLGGPSHTVCSEEGSAARALERAVRALQLGEIDRALVGGVDLAGDPRCDPQSILPGGPDVRGEGAAAFVLKRLPDAERDGDRVYAVIRGIGSAGGEPGRTSLSRAEGQALEQARADAGWEPQNGAMFDATADVGRTGAASAAASLAKACLALYQEIVPPGCVPQSPGQLGRPASGPRYWLHDRASGPRRAAIAASGADGSAFAVLLEEHARNATDAVPTAERAQPLGARTEAAFAVDGASAADLVAGLDLLAEFAPARASRNIEAVAREWFRTSPPNPKHPLAVALVARSADELAEQLTFVVRSLRANPDEPLPADPRPAIRDRVFFTPKPLGPKAKVALVFPGSGNQFGAMGRDLAPHWPEVLRRQHAESELLRSQFAPELFWDGKADDAPHRDLMFGQVAVGSLVADVVASLGVPCDAMIGLSLGESAGLFAVRAWRGRDEMWRRMHKSTLFVSDLAPPYDAARALWGLRAGKAVDWASGVLAAAPDDVTRALRPGLRAYLLIVNTPTECVIGGVRADVEKLAAAVGGAFFPLSGVTLAHCEAGRPVEVAYRELHTLPVTPPKGVTVFSGAWGCSYPVSERAAADSITAGLLNTIDVPAVVVSAYRAGVRVFVEAGPGASCARMIDVILGDRPHLARAAHAAKSDAVSHILRLVANLVAERVRVDLGSLYCRDTLCVGHREPAATARPELVIPVGTPSPESAVEPPPEPSSPVVPASAPDHGPEPEPVPVAASDGGPSLEAPALPGPSADVAASLAPAIAATCAARIEVMRAQEAFLRLNRKLTDSLADVIRMQTAIIDTWVRGGAVALRSEGSASRRREGVPRSLSYEQCRAFAVGRVGDVLGPSFAGADSFPTRVRLPDGPLQLVDQILLIEGEPRSMTRGRVVTTHAVRPDRWYLEAGRIPTAISVEAGQADLFLSGFLGIDFQTRGLAVYRLLDAVVSFHRGLPQVGETVTYDIHIDEFTKQADAWLFRFRFDGTVSGEPFITMRNGVAGFFTADALAAGRGIVQTALDKQRLPGKRPDDWRDLVPLAPCSLGEPQVDALRRGDLAAAFGPEFTPDLREPLPLPGGMLRLVDRVPLIDPSGGRFGLGFVRAEFDIHPDDWFLTCHFVDDMVMPGTLMYECCLHTLRALLARIGWVGETGAVVCEPVPGVNSRLKCRGQVTATTKTVTYEVTVKELGYRPVPYCLADALMYADGKPIVEITNMSLRMTGLTRERLERVWSPASRVSNDRGLPQAPPVHTGGSPGHKPALYDGAKILAFSNGNPSEAFGEPYRVFDRDRVVARLPGPPYQFLDRVTAVRGAPFVLKAGAGCEAQYAIPPDAWYFAQNSSETMPFSVLLEVALQPCGWLAAYCGSALTSPEDLAFRNLGGRATQFRPVTPDSGTLTTNVAMTNVSQSAGMIVQHYDMLVSDRAGKVYEGTTYFGFFSRPALADQVGIRDAKVPWPTGQDVARAGRGELPHDPPFPAPVMRMIDRIEAYLPDGGRRGLGLVVGRITVDPSFWFFMAHFYQDPVWPGSLGLESFLQLLKYAAWKRWGAAPPGGWQAVALDRPHTWSYRGQVVPTDKEVTVLLEVTAADDAARRLTADGFLTVDGRVIYQMTDFTLE